MSHSHEKYSGGLLVLPYIAFSLFAGRGDLGLYRRKFSNGVASVGAKPGQLNALGGWRELFPGFQTWRPK